MENTKLQMHSTPTAQETNLLHGVGREAVLSNKQPMSEHGYDYVNSIPRKINCERNSISKPTTKNLQATRFKLASILRGKSSVTAAQKCAIDLQTTRGRYSPGTIAGEHEGRGGVRGRTADNDEKYTPSRKPLCKRNIVSLSFHLYFSQVFSNKIFPLHIESTRNSGERTS